MLNSLNEKKKKDIKNIIDMLIYYTQNDLKLFIILKFI